MNVLNYANEWDELESFERDEFIGDSINSVIRFLLSLTPDAGQADKDRLKKVLIKKSYAKTLYRVVKGRQYDIDLTLVVVLSDILVEERPKDDEVSDLVRDLFLRIIEIMITKKTNELCKKCKIARPIVTNLILECPDDLERDCVPGNLKYYFINRLINKCYYIPDIVESNEISFDYGDIDRFVKLMTEILGEENIVKFAANILLEPRAKYDTLEENQIVMWDMLTRVALTIINDLDLIKQRGTTRRTITNLYIKRREMYVKKGQDVERRINLTEVNPDEYPSFGKAVEDILERFDEPITNLLK